jgi:hypothetical protein
VHGHSALQLSSEYAIQAIDENAIKISGMSDIVEAEDGTSMTYKQYLDTYVPIVQSSDPDKFHELQDCIRAHFLGPNQEYIKSVAHMTLAAPKYMKGGSEIDNYKLSDTSLSMLICLTKCGFYYQFDRLYELLSIVTVVLTSHTAETADPRQIDDNREKEVSAGDLDLNNDGASSHGSQTSTAGGAEGLELGSRSHSRSDEFKLKSLQYLSLSGGARLETQHYDSTENDDALSRSLRVHSLQGYLPAMTSRNSNDDDASKRSKRREEGVGSDAHESGNPLQSRDIVSDRLLQRSSTLRSGDRPLLAESDDERDRRRGPELTRLCRRHDQSKIPEVMIQHIYENQRLVI